MSASVRFVIEVAENDGIPRPADRRHLITPDHLHRQRVKTENSFVQSNGTLLLTNYKRGRRLTSPENDRLLFCV